MPLPVYSPLFGGQSFRVTYDEAQKRVVVKPTPPCPSIISSVEASTLAHASASPPVLMQQNSIVAVTEITLRQTEHSNSPAEVYFRIYIDGAERKLFGVPTRDNKHSWLLLLDGRKAQLTNVRFSVPMNAKVVRIELWDRDRSIRSLFKGGDNRLAVFDSPVQVGKKILHDRDGAPTTLGVHISPSGS